MGTTIVITDKKNMAFMKTKVPAPRISADLKSLIKKLIDRDSINTVGDAVTVFLVEENPNQDIYLSFEHSYSGGQDHYISINLVHKSIGYYLPFNPTPTIFTFDEFVNLVDLHFNKFEILRLVGKIIKFNYINASFNKSDKIIKVEKVDDSAQHIHGTDLVTESPRTYLVNRIVGGASAIKILD